MDPRNAPDQHPWSRPHSQPTARDSRQQTPIPAPLYAIQGAPPPLPSPPSGRRPQTYFNNDLFLSRKNDRAGPALDLQASKPPFSVGASLGAQQQYGTSVSREALGPQMVQEKEQEWQGAWAHPADGRDDRYKSLGAEGEHDDPDSSLFMPFHFRSCYAMARENNRCSSSPHSLALSLSSYPQPLIAHYKHALLLRFCVHFLRS